MIVRQLDGWTDGQTMRQLDKERDNLVKNLVKWARSLIDKYLAGQTENLIDT